MNGRLAPADQGSPCSSSGGMASQAKSRMRWRMASSFASETAMRNGVRGDMARLLQTCRITFSQASTTGRTVSAFSDSRLNTTRFTPRSE